MKTISSIIKLLVAEKFLVFKSNQCRLETTSTSVTIYGHIRLKTMDSSAKPWQSAAILQ